MRRLSLPAAFLFVALASIAAAQEGGKFTLKTGTAMPPAELSEPIRKLLGGPSLELHDGAGNAVLELWARKEVPTDATPEQVKNGITYREIKQSEVLGAVRFVKDWSDYRKQKIKAGVYTLRLAYQPTDGKHTADISEFQDFVALLTAKADAKPDLLEPMKLQEASSDSLGSTHPGVLMLVPGKAAKGPELVARANNHWVIVAPAALTSGGKATGARVAIGFNVVGHSPAE